MKVTKIIGKIFGKEVYTLPRPNGVYEKRVSLQVYKEEESSLTNILSNLIKIKAVKSLGKVIFV